MTKKTSLRFAVGTAGEYRSGIWHLFTHKAGVYLAARHVGRFFKLSMHRGDWRLAWTSESGVTNEAGERVIRRWAPQPQFRPGWTQGPTLVFPHTGLVRPFSRGVDDDLSDVVWLPTPQPNWKTSVILNFVSPEAPPESWDEVLAAGDALLSRLPLDAGWTLAVVRRLSRMEELEARSLAEVAAASRINVTSQHADGIQASMFRAGVDSSGLAWLVDIPLGWENVVGPDGPL